MIVAFMMIIAALATYLVTARAYEKEIDRQLERYTQYFTDAHGFKIGEFRHIFDSAGGYRRVVWDSEYSKWIDAPGDNDPAPVGVRRGNVAFTDGIDFMGGGEK